MKKQVLKMNRYFVNGGDKKIFVVLSLLIAVSFIFSTAFLLMTISYKYSLTQERGKLNKIILTNSLKETKIFNLENKKYKENINKDLVFADSVRYLKTTENFAMNYQRR